MKSAKKAAGFPWIKWADFSHVTFWVQLVNVTTQTPLKENESAEIPEFDFDGISVRVPLKFCAFGHLILVRIATQVEEPGKRFRKNQMQHGDFEATAKVIEAERVNADSQLIRLKFYQFDEVKWRKLITDYEGLQEKLNNIVKNMKA